MRDGLAAGHFAFGAFHINMDPLMIAGDLGKAINQILRHFQPIADTQFLPDQRPERFRGFNHAHCSPPPSIRTNIGRGAAGIKPGYPKRANCGLISA